MSQLIEQLKQRLFGLEIISDRDIAPEKDELLISDTDVKKDIGTGKFSLSEVLERLTEHEEKSVNAFIFRNKKEVSLESLAEQEMTIESELDEKDAPKILLYEFVPGGYYVYRRRDNRKENRVYEHKTKPEENKKDNFTYSFSPTGIIVRSVPEHILGVGVLGRAFIHSNYIEILDTLMGQDYVEVLTHEILHIKMPHYSEMKIREITRNYIPNARYN
ncbi:hypothetical protein JXB41_02415 [Candidatus Woesearchaeota archaeon]|nr:hypothetical protein [Candidatus Woesearchaeota archaeon]